MRSRFANGSTHATMPFPGAPDRTRILSLVLKTSLAVAFRGYWRLSFNLSPIRRWAARLLGYIAGLLLNYKPDEERGSRFLPGAAVVNLTGKGSTSFESLWEEAGLELTFKIQERNLETESAADLLAG